MSWIRSRGQCGTAFNRRRIRKALPRVAVQASLAENVVYRGKSAPCLVFINLICGSFARD